MSNYFTTEIIREKLKKTMYNEIFQNTLKNNDELINKLKKEIKDFDFEPLIIKLTERSEKFAQDYSEMQIKYGTDMAELVKNELKQFKEVEVTI